MSFENPSLDLPFCAQLQRAVDESPETAVKSTNDTVGAQNAATAGPASVSTPRAIAQSVFGDYLNQNGGVDDNSGPEFFVDSRLTQKDIDDRVVDLVQKHTTPEIERLVARLKDINLHDLDSYDAIYRQLKVLNSDVTLASRFLQGMYPRKYPELDEFEEFGSYIYFLVLTGAFKTSPTDPSKHVAFLNINSDGVDVSPMRSIASFGKASRRKRTAITMNGNGSESEPTDESANKVAKIDGEKESATDDGAVVASGSSAEPRTEDDEEKTMLKNHPLLATEFYKDFVGAFDLAPYAALAKPLQLAFMYASVHRGGKRTMSVAKQDKAKALSLDAIEVRFSKPIISNLYPVPVSTKDGKSHTYHNSNLCPSLYAFINDATNYKPIVYPSSRDRLNINKRMTPRIINMTSPSIEGTASVIDGGVSFENKLNYTSFTRLIVFVNNKDQYKTNLFTNTYFTVDNRPDEEYRKKLESSSSARRRRIKELKTFYDSYGYDFDVPGKEEINQQGQQQQQQQQQKQQQQQQQQKKTEEKKKLENSDDDASDNDASDDDASDKD